MFLEALCRYLCLYLVGQNLKGGLHIAFGTQYTVSTVMWIASIFSWYFIKVTSKEVNMAIVCMPSIHKAKKLLSIFYVLLLHWQYKDESDILLRSL